jgi:hypothetical protein
MQMPSSPFVTSRTSEMRRANTNRSSIILCPVGVPYIVMLACFAACRAKERRSIASSSPSLGLVLVSPRSNFMQGGSDACLPARHFTLSWNESDVRTLGYALEDEIFRGQPSLPLWFIHLLSHPVSSPLPYGMDRSSSPVGGRCTVSHQPCFVRNRVTHLFGLAARTQGNTRNPCATGKVGFHLVLSGGMDGYRDGLHVCRYVNHPQHPYLLMRVCNFNARIAVSCFVGA